MADAKKPDVKKDDQSWFITFFPIVIIVILLFLSVLTSGYSIFGGKVQDPVVSNLGKNFTQTSSWVGKGNLGEDVVIINSSEVIVRNSPAGAIVGKQKKLETGIIRNGPANEFGVDWWRIDYPDAPDGWVNSEQISSKIGWVRAVNIIPILWGFYKPIGYVLVFLLLILVIYYRLKLYNELQITEKKRKLKEEQYKTPPVPLAVLVEQKPDVEEIEGFRTEEIVPAKVLEQENRWSNIQDLLKSYNANDWKQAIIDADMMLEDLLIQIGYEGVSIGDKLKNVERSDFITLNNAWEAHKVRNQIAHDPTFKLSREIAEKTIKNFEEVFKEFYVI